MAFVQLQCAPWDKIYSVASSLPGLKVCDQVVAKVEAVQDIARVIEVADQAPAGTELDEGVELVRLASAEDLAKEPISQAEWSQAWSYAHDSIKLHGLDMKLVDLRYSWDGGRLTFAFVADNRIDFRSLVKDLSKFFNRQIRLQQIGIRDEARLVGDTGRCGRGLCCRNHLCKFSSVTGEMAEAQGLSTRGSDRISGACGRLMCCLSYEVEGYKHLAGKVPPVGSKVNVDGRRGTVVAQHLLKESVSVRFSGEKGEDDYIVEVDLKKRKEKQR